MEQSWRIQIISRTYNSCRSWSQHTVEHKRWNEALVLCSRIWFHQIAVLTEETLDMHLKSIGALEVVGEQNSPSHDDKLKIQHGHTETLVAFLTDASMPSSHSSPAEHPPFTITPTALTGTVCQRVRFCAPARRHPLHKPFGKRH